MPKFHRVKQESDKIPMSDYNLKSDYLEALTNMKVTGGKFTISRAGASLEIDDGPKTLFYWVRLTTDIAKASGPADSGVFLGYGVRLVSSGGDLGETLADSDNQTEIIITNRDPNFEAKAGDTILVARVHLGTVIEWQPLNPFGILNDGGDDGGQGFPPGTEGCLCSDCSQGVTIPSATVCCTSFLKWTFINPITLEGMELEYAGSDTWVSQEFDGPECDCTEGGDCPCLGDPEAVCNNVYRWVLVPSQTAGSSTLTLEIIEDNGCPATCVIYRKYNSGWQCQCVNEMQLSPNWGGLHEGKVLPCRVCIKPKTPEIEWGEGAAWLEPICGIDPEDLPIAWMFSHDQMTGLLCPSIANSLVPIFKYSGTQIVANGVAVDIWADVNNLSTVPLVRASKGSSGASWASPVVVVGETVFDYLTGETKNQIMTASLSIQCSYSTQTDTYTLKFSLYFGNIPSTEIKATYEGGSGSLGPLIYEITGILPDDLVCEINQLREITWTGVDSPFNSRCTTPTQPFDTCQEGCLDVFDPDPSENYYAPTTITISPFGGGPPECENPPIGDQPALPPPTDSGTCSGCTPDTSTPDPDDGSCCVEGECLQFISEALCTSFSGTSYANQASCEEECFLAACCYISDEALGESECEDSLTQEECLAFGTSADLELNRWIPNLSCANVACDQWGCCCLGGGTEDGEEMTKLDCQYEGGTFYLGQNCGGGLCNFPVGSCCDGFTCTDDVAEGDCAGTWYEGESCAGAECGCCCHPTSLDTCDGGNPCLETDGVPKSLCDTLTGDGAFGDFNGGISCASTGCNCSPGEGNTCRIPG